MEKTSSGVYGIDRYVLDDGKVRIALRRQSDPGYKFGKFLSISITFAVVTFVAAGVIGSSLENFTNIRLGPGDPTTAIFMLGALLAIWPAHKIAQSMPRERSKSFLFDDQTLTDEESKNTYERRYIAADYEQVVAAYTAKNAGELNSKGRGVQKVAETRGNNAIIYHGSKQVYLMHGLAERQAAVFADMIRKWHEDPESLHVHDI